MRYRILGALEVRDDRGQVLTVSGTKQRALVALLLLNANQQVSADRLIDDLWKDEPPASARHSLHLLVHRFRRALAGADAEQVLRTEGSGYLLAVEPGQLDADRFRDLVQRAAADADRPREALRGYDGALALWQGPPLGEFSGMAFARPVIARLEELRITALTGRAEAALALGRHAELVPDLEELVHQYPLQERLRRVLILALYRCGRQADALAAYQSARRELVQQLGIEPSEELRALERAILSQDPALLPAAGPAGGRASTPPAGNPPVSGSPVIRSPAASPPAEPAPPTAPAAAPPPGASGRRAERRMVTVLAVAQRAAPAAPVDPDDLLDPEDLGDPEDLWALHDAALEALRRLVEPAGGQVHAGLGETLTAVFGAVRAHADDPERAVRAALEVAAALTGPPVAVGVDTGEAVVMTAPGEATPRISGAITKAAASLAAVASAGEVLVGAGTHRVTERVFEFQPAELTAGPVGTVWKLVGAAAPGAAAAAPVVGRERELLVLGELLDRARDELEPQLVTIIGTPGVGKTRLVAELRAHGEAGPDPVTWWEGRSLPYGEGVTYWALAEIVKASAGIRATDSAEEAEGKLRAAVGAVFGDTAEAVWVAEYLGRLVRPEAAAGDDAGWQAEAFMAWRGFFEHLPGPLVLVFDDLHWADAALLDFVEHLAGHTEAVPLLIVCVAWPELLDRRPDWGGGLRNATTISLGPLGPAHVERLLDALLGDAREALPPGRRAQLLAGSGGNPLFVEEYVRMLRGRGATPGGLVPPETVQMLIAARLDDLEEGDRALLTDAAVLGEVVWSGGLTAISGRDPDEVAAVLRRLVRREFLRRSRSSRIPGQVEYAFRHVLIRDVAYGRLLRAERAERHRRAAEWLTSFGGDRAADRAELVAHHYQQAVAYARAAGQPVEHLAGFAAPALRRAGDRALALAAYPAAVRYYTQALELWPPDLPGRLEVQLAREELHFELQRDTDPARLAELRDGLLAEGDRIGAATAQTTLATLLWTRGHAKEAARNETEARELLRGTEPSVAKARVACEMAVNLGRLGSFAEALAVAREARTVARSLELPKLEAMARATIGWARAGLGDPAGVEELREGVAALDELRSAVVPRWHAYLALAQGHMGDLEGFSAGIAATKASCERFDAKGTLIWNQGHRAHELYLAGRWDEACETAEDLLARLREAGATHYAEAWCRSVRGKIRLARDDPGGALEDAARACEFTHDADDHPLLGAATLRGTLLVAGGDHAAAREIAADLATRVAGHPLFPIAGADLPDLLVACGQPADTGDVPGHGGSRWLHALRVMVAGHPEQAAEVYAAMGARPDEALAHLRAAERRLPGAATGDQDRRSALDHLARSRAFYEEVGAPYWLRQVDEAHARAARP